MQNNSISLGLLEETELLVSVLCPLCNYVDEWASSSPAVYDEFKDLLLFAVPHLVSYFQSSGLQPFSNIELHLNELKRDNNRR